MRWYVYFRISRPCGFGISGPWSMMVSQMEYWDEPGPTPYGEDPPLPGDEWKLRPRVEDYTVTGILQFCGGKTHEFTGEDGLECLRQLENNPRLAERIFKYLKIEDSSVPVSVAPLQGLPF